MVSLEQDMSSLTRLGTRLMCQMICRALRDVHRGVVTRMNSAICTTIHNLIGDSINIYLAAVVNTSDFVNDCLDIRRRQFLLPIKCVQSIRFLFNISPRQALAFDETWSWEH